MTEQEKFNAEVHIRLAKQDVKFELVMEELKQQREDIRRVQDRQDAAQAQHSAYVKALEAKIDRLGDKIQNMVIAAVVGFGAIVFAAVSALK